MPGAITVTLDATANPSYARNAASPALTASLAIMVIAAVTLAGAWFFQLVLEILPCPLCLEQRYAYYFAVPFAGYNVLISLLMAAIAAWGIARTTRRP